MLKQFKEKGHMFGFPFPLEIPTHSDMEQLLISYTFLSIIQIESSQTVSFTE